ncbi:MAG: hypothetical protein ABIG44_07455 [Planctomycetota bacterium]
MPFNTEPKLANFRSIPRDATEQTQTVTITRGDGEPLKLEVIEPKDKKITTNLREIEAGEKYELDITVRPPWPNDSLRGSIVLKTGLEQTPHETIRIYGTVDPRLQANPPRFQLPQDVITETELKVDLVWSGADPPGKILSAASTDPSLLARVETNEKVQSIIITVPPNYERKRGTALLVNVTTDDPVASQLRIPVIGAVRRSVPSGAKTSQQPGSIQGPTKPVRSSGKATSVANPQRLGQSSSARKPITAAPTSQPIKKADPDQ